jgi:excisionase family DNA binding protein
MDDDERFLFGRKRVATLLDISVRTVDYLVQNGQLVPIRIGKRIMFSRAAIERFIRKDHSTK